MPLVMQLEGPSVGWHRRPELAGALDSIKANPIFVLGGLGGLLIGGWLAGSLTGRALVSHWRKR